MAVAVLNNNKKLVKLALEYWNDAGLQYTYTDQERQELKRWANSNSELKNPIERKMVAEKPLLVDIDAKKLSEMEEEIASMKKIFEERKKKWREEVVKQKRKELISVRRREQLKKNDFLIKKEEEDS